ncbi:MAG: hypothetical protein COB15_03900 [Flavobacteriales bacterium]|nr:MAG: hypothetical protein COB15_03900 [Flavobacteriales bacterium]
MKYQVSIIIPTINREDKLKQTLYCLEKQITVTFEILVIYQSEFNQFNIDIFPDNVSFIKSHNESASAARNIGIRNSKSDILLFIDDDVLIKNQYFVYNHHRHYIDKNISGVVGRSFDKYDTPISYSRTSRSFNHIVGFFYYPKNYGVNTFVNSGRSNNLSVRKNIAIAVGGMDENYTRGAHREETDFCLRVSKKYGLFLYDANATLIHLNEPLGGIRSWNDSNYIKAKHNMVGAIYFDLKMAPTKFRLEYFLATLRYLILNKTILIRPQLYYTVITRVINSFITAYKAHKSGPKYLN